VGTGVVGCGQCCAACLTRSVVWRFWAAVLLLSDMLVHLVHAGTLKGYLRNMGCFNNPAACTSVDRANAYLTGTLPTELGLLTAVDFFNVGNNQITGTLPTELGRMTALAALFNVRFNNLNGPLPTELGLLTSLAAFYVHNNDGLCGNLVSVGTVTTNYNTVAPATTPTYATNLGNICPTASPTTSSPTSSPTETTSSPTSSPTETTSSPTATRSPTSIKPCCETLRENLIFCCIEARNPALAQSVCQECGTGK